MNRSAAGNIIDNSQWPLNTFLVSHKHRVIYTPIAKNASTSLKNLFVRLHGPPHSEAILTQNVHEYLVSHKTGLSLCDYTPAEAANILNDDRYFKFVVLRNPLARAVSGYLEKFVLHAQNPCTGNESPIVIGSAIDWVYHKRGEPSDYARSITFEEFADYLIHNADEHLDTHFKSQESYFGNQQFDFVGAMEKIGQLQTVLESKFNQAFEIEKENKIRTMAAVPFRRGLEKLLPEQIRSLQFLPHTKELLNRGVKSSLQKRFSYSHTLWKGSLRS